MFFFAKKKQKTFVILGIAHDNSEKVFCFFFSKKKRLLYSS